MAASDSDDDDEPLCAAPGGDNNAVALEFLKPGTTGAVFVVFNCAVFVLLCSCVALCFTDLPWYHTAMVSMIDPSERTQTTFIDVFRFSLRSRFSRSACLARCNGSRCVLPRRQEDPCRIRWATRRKRDEDGIRRAFIHIFRASGFVLRIYASC